MGESDTKEATGIFKNNADKGMQPRFRNKSRVKEREEGSKQRDAFP